MFENCCDLSMYALLVSFWSIPCLLGEMKSTNPRYFFLNFFSLDAYTQSLTEKFVLLLMMLPLMARNKTVDCRYRPLSRIGQLPWPDTKTKHTTGKSKQTLVSGPVVRVIHQSIAKRHQFENCDYYKVLYGR